MVSITFGGDEGNGISEKKKKDQIHVITTILYFKQLTVNGLEFKVKV